MLLPMFAILPASASDAVVAADAKSFTEPVNAGSDKYYTTKTLQTVDFTKIKSDAELAAAGVTYLDASATDSYGVSYVDDGVYYYATSDTGYILSDVKLASDKSYIVDFTIRANPESHILEASAAFTDKTTINTTYGGTIDKAGAFKLRLKSSNSSVSKLDNGTYYSDAACTTSIGAMLDSDAQTAIYTNQEDVRVKMLFTGGTWKYAELSVAGETYYIYYNNASTAHTGYFGFRGVGNTQIVFKNITISECSKESATYATVVSDGRTYRVAAGTVIDATVYNETAVALESGGFYYGATATAEAGKLYTVIAQNSNLFVAPVNAGNNKYYPTKTLQTVDFTTIKSDTNLAAAGITYLDADATDECGVSYIDGGVNYYTQSDKGYLLSNVKMDSGTNYIVDFTFRGNPTLHILEASAAFPDKTTISSTVRSTVDGKAFKIRLKDTTALMLDGAQYYSDSACTSAIGSQPGEAAQNAAYTDKADVRVRLLFTGGNLQYGEVIVDGKTYYVKMNSAKSGQTGYFGFLGIGEVNVVLKNLTISECSTSADSYATVVSEGRTYRVAAGSTIYATAYNRSAIAVEAGGTYYDGTVTAEAGKLYNIVIQHSDLFIAPVNVGNDKYYTTKTLQTVDFTDIKSDADLTDAGITYLDAVANDGYDISYSNDGLHYCTSNNMGYLLSNVQMSSGTSYIADFTFSVNPSAHIFVASAAFPDKTSISSSVGTSVDGKSIKIRAKDGYELMLDGAQYYSDQTYATAVGTQPDEAAQTAAIADKMDVRVRMLFTGGTWQYAEFIVDGKVYYVKANSAKSGQTGYFGFLGFGAVDVIIKNLTISECSNTASSYATVVCGSKMYRVAAGTVIDATVYSKNAIAIVENGICTTGAVTAEAGKTYTVRAIEDINITWAGASVRLTDEPGLRFATLVSKEDISLLDQLKTSGRIKSYSYGTLITYASYAEEVDGAVTHAALDAFADKVGIENSYVDVEATDWYDDTDEDYAFVGSIVKITTNHYTKEYASAGYITVTMADDSQVTVYTEYSPANARSVSYVAACAYYDTSVQYTDDQNAVLEAFIGDEQYYPFVLNGECDYTVVYDADDATAMKLASDVVNALAESGIAVALKADTSAVSGKGLYIGATSHAVSAAGDAYYINSHIGADASGNIAVTGNLEVGVAKILEEINRANAGKIDTILFDESLLGWYVEDGFANIPKYEGSGASGATVNHTFDGYNSYYIQISGVTKDDFNTYISKLESEGYTRDKDFTSRNGDPVRVYTNGEALVTVSYVDYSSSSYSYDTISGTVAYITIGVNTVKTSGVLTRDTTGGVCDLQVTLVGTECGYLIRLTNGHFVIVDGGLKEYNYDFIYEQLVAQNVLDGKPVIEAWFFTHPHTDHIGSYLQFAKSYYKSVELETVVQHFPAYEVYDDECSEGTAENAASVVKGMKSNSEAVLNHTKQYFPEAKIVTTYRGQRFAFAGVTFDVFFTSENLYDSNMINTNSSSVVYQLTFSGSGKKMLILGDMYYDGCKLLNLIYGTGLASDVVQIAHHGYNGGDSDMYKTVNAPYVIWTNSYAAATDSSNNLMEKNNSYNHITGGLEAATNFQYHIIPTDSQNTGTPVILKWGMTKAELQAMGVMTPVS